MHLGDGLAIKYKELIIRLFILLATANFKILMSFDTFCVIRDNSENNTTKVNAK